MTHCRKFCFKTALFCAVVVKSKEKWGQGEFLESKSDRFHSLSASANNQEKQKDWKYKRDFFFFFFDSGWKNSDLDEMYFKTVHFLFVNIGNYGSCWSIYNLTSYLSSRVSSLEKLLALSCTCGWHCNCPKDSFSCNCLLKHFTTRLSWRQDCNEMLWSTA